VALGVTVARTGVTADTGPDRRDRRHWAESDFSGCREGFCTPQAPLPAGPAGPGAGGRPAAGAEQCFGAAIQ
jgi:hypothetical protein